MIKVTRLNKTSFVVNTDLIEFIEETPNTVITLTTGKKIIVAESIDELVEKIVEYKKKLSVLPSFDKIYRDEV